MIEYIVRTVTAKLKSQGIKSKTTRLTSDWGEAEKYLDRFLKNSILLGLNQTQQIPEGYGCYLLFSKSQDPKEAASQLEVSGNWIWISSSISSLTISNNEPFSTQAHSELVSQSNLHIGQKVIAFRLYRPLPHLALEFSDGSVLAIHGDTGQFESWVFDTWGSNSVGVYAISGGPIAVG